MSFPAFAWLATAVDGLVVAAMLFRPWQLPRARRSGEAIAVSLTTLLITALALCPLGMLKLYVARLAGANIFGVMRLLYLDCVVALPVLALLVLVVRGRRWRVSRSVKLLAGLGVMAAPLGAYATLVEPFRTRLETTTVTIPAARAGREPITLGVLADIQTDDVGKHEIAAVEMLMRQKPDLILINGDLWQGYFDGDLPTGVLSLRTLLARLSAPGGVYFVRGNLENGWDPRPIFAGTTVQMLSNDILHLRVRDREVMLAGIDGMDRAGCRRILEELESPLGERDIRLLVGHYPDTLLDMRPHSRVDLFVAGHTHGGQVVLPLIGPLLTFSHVPRDIAAGGLHDLDGRRIYVSRGVGCERGQAPRLRLLCPPEVSLLTLKNP